MFQFILWLGFISLVIYGLIVAPFVTIGLLILFSR